MVFTGLLFSELYRDSQSRTLLKALQPPPRGETEKNFYKEVIK